MFFVPWAVVVPPFAFVDPAVPVCEFFLQFAPAVDRDWPGWD